MFPLRGVILLPRSEVPLNVFEPRYLTMIEDVMAGERIVGIIQPDQDADHPGRTPRGRGQGNVDSNAAPERPVESPDGRAVPLKRVGCAGRVTGYQELHDGRIGVTLTGIARFTIEDEPITDKPYRLCHVDYSEFSADFAADATTEAIDRDALLRI